MLHLSLTIGLFFWPFWSAIIIGFFGSKLGARWSGFFAIFCLIITATVALYTFILIGFGEYKLKLPLFLCFCLPADIEIFKWAIPYIPTNSSITFPLPVRTFYTVYWGFLFDSVTVVMLVVITSISALVHVYAFSYMAKDSHVQRFFACLSLFTFFMLMLVIADNYFQLFVGWEGVGLCSYLLITFWYTRAQANKSALQALVVNKVGDLALVLSLILIFILYKNTAFDFLFLQESLDRLHLGFYIGLWHLSTGEVIGFLFFIGAVAKSAQLGLHTWLLSAMEGPTPVSALLHAATMVTAGIFLMIRSAPFLNYATNTMFFITILGAITALFAATCGLVQHDIKKIIAFSTCSQLGYMFYSCGLGNYSASLYHLTNHAFFKALLFMGAGAVIHALQGEQDLRRMGGLIKLMPVTYSAMLLASLSLLGFPFLSGFYSKDVLIELAWTHSSLQGTFSFWLAVFAAFLTAFYSTRLLHYVFISNSNGYQHVTKYVHEADFIMLWSFRPLIVGSLFVGYCLRSIFVGFGSTFFASSNLLNNFHLNNLVDSEFLPYYTKLIPVIFSFSGLLLALVIYNNTGLFNTLVNQQRYNFIIREIHIYLNKKWNFDIVYNKGIALNIYDLGGTLYKAGDQGLLEFVGPQGINSFLSSFRFNKILSPTGYMEVILKGVIIYLLLFVLNDLLAFNNIAIGLASGPVLSSKELAALLEKKK
jgi:proton-translocating NADH-quinone oxidoreductase chain L